MRHGVEAWLGLGRILLAEPALPHKYRAVILPRLPLGMQGPRLWLCLTQAHKPGKGKALVPGGTDARVQGPRHPPKGHFPGGGWGARRLDPERAWQGVRGRHWKSGSREATGSGRSQPSWGGELFLGLRGAAPSLAADDEPGS